MLLNSMFIRSVATLLFIFSAVNLSAEAQSSPTSTIPADVMASIEKHVSSNSWPKIYYDVMPPVIEKHQFKTVVEVGVALGGHAENLLKNTTIESYVGIDPYLYNFDPADGFSQDVGKYSSLPGQRNFDYLYAWVKEHRLAPYATRTTLIRDFSVNAAAQFEDESIDCIFIDGDHRYDAVMKDLQAWFPKLRKGGMIAGDDYWMSSVAKAVNDYFASQHRKDLFFLTSASGYRIWAVIK